MILIHQRHRQTDGQTDRRTERRTDGQHAISIPRYALVHRAVIIGRECYIRSSRPRRETNKYECTMDQELSDIADMLISNYPSETLCPSVVRRCLENKAPKYLSVHCTPVTAVSSRHLRSANQCQLIVPRCRRITFGRRAFSVAGPTVWNSLQTEFRSLSVSFGDLDAR